METSRTKNVYRNSYIGLVSQILIAIFSFVSRTIFIKTLGVEYLGVNGLYSNILTMLALSDLGIYTVMVYSLYKPIADKDYERIAILIKYFKKLYWAIAVVVLILGLICIPFLPHLIKNSNLSTNEIVKYYVLYLMNSVCSYIAISKSTLLRANQRVDIIQIITMITTLGVDVVQIIFLLLYHNFTQYLVIQIIFTLINNCLLTVIANKKYPYLKQYSSIAVPRDMKINIVKNLKATFLYKIGNVVMNSTDNILISMILGTGIVGYYSNYFTVIAMINKFIMILINAMLASIGNYFASENETKSYKLFKQLIFIFGFVAATCCSCYICGMDDFIYIWIGEEYIIGGGFIYALAFYRFVYCFIHPIWMTRESTGIFISTRYVMGLAAIINILLSVLLGRIIGLSGIIIATALSYLLTTFWYEPLQMKKHVFKNSMIDYWKHVIKVLLTSAVVIGVSCTLRLWVTHNIILLFVKFIICGCCSTLIFFITFRNSDEFKWCIQKLANNKRIVQVIKKS